MKKSAQQKVKHKPNARHTLSEVLHSLQDLMHNEFAGVSGDEADKQAAKNGAPRNKKEVLDSLKALISDSANSSKSEEPRAADKEVKSLSAGEPLAGEETETCHPAEQDSGIEAQTEDIPPVGKAPAETTVSGDESIIEEDKVDEISQQRGQTPTEPETAGALMSDGETAAPPGADDFKLEMENTRNPEPGGINRSSGNNNKKKPHSRKTYTTTNDAGEQVEIVWNDIPVLNEVVALPPGADSATAQEARDIAIKVAAALNIEARKEGDNTIDIKTIMRLKSLLSQELQDRQEAGEPGTTDKSGDEKTRGDDI